MIPLDRFRYILAMAAADERMNESELEFLSNRAMQLGITDDQFEAALKEAIEGKADLDIPSDPPERLRSAEGLDPHDGGGWPARRAREEAVRGGRGYDAAVE